MEGELSSQLESSHAIASPYYVLGVGRAPDPAFAAWMAVFGLVVLAGGLVWWRLKYATVAA
jgi:hypothetical protein